MTRSRRIGFIVFSGVMIISLLALAGWQVQRMQWKSRLIEQSISALTAKPVTINDITAGIEYGFDVDWLRVRLTGTYRHDLERYYYRPTKQGIGYQVITPFIEDSGFIVFVDRGWVSEAAKDPKTRKSARQPENKITITGVSRVHASGLALFQADPDTANNVWYWYDLTTLTKSLPPNLGETTAEENGGQLPIVSPVFVQLEPKGEPGEGAWPKIEPVKLGLANNHKQYAITWFLLGIIMMLMLILFLRKK